jgi:protein gp37
MAPYGTPKMAEKTGISWTNHTWNPWKGCAKVSPGCTNCYMFREMERFGLNPKEITRTKTWNKPKKWNKEAETKQEPALVFTASWSDFFIKEADEWRADAWKIIKETTWLQWQILTKRIERVPDHLPDDWGEGYPNVWLGVSIESATYNHRADALRKIPARIRFISAEPLLASLKGLELKDVHWLIAGGESGPDYRPMDIDWVRELRDMCNYNEGVAFYYKQEAGFLPSKNPPLLDGRTWEEFPEIWTPNAIHTKVQSQN